MPMNIERFFTKENRQARVKELKKAGVPHVCQHTTVARNENDKWETIYCVTFPPQMASRAELEAIISESNAHKAVEELETLPQVNPNDPVVTSQPLPETQAIEAAESEGMANVS